jgi:hypothetical protein
MEIAMSQKIKSNILSNTQNTENALIDVFLDEVEDINNLIKIQSVFSISPETEVRVNARRTLNREIYHRIDSLAVHIIEFFKSKDEKAKS